MSKYYNTHHLSMFNKAAMTAYLESPDGKGYAKSAMGMEQAKRLGVAWVGSLSVNEERAVLRMWDIAGITMPFGQLHAQSADERFVLCPCIGAERTREALRDVGIEEKTLSNGDGCNVLFVPEECGGLWWSGKYRTEEGGVSYDGPAVAGLIRKRI